MQVTITTRSEVMSLQVEEISRTDGEARPCARISIFGDEYWRRHEGYITLCDVCSVIREEEGLLVDGHGSIVSCRYECLMRVDDAPLCMDALTFYTYGSAQVRSRAGLRVRIRARMEFASTLITCMCLEQF